MSEARDIERAGLVAHEAAGKIQSAASGARDVVCQLGLAIESLQQERRRRQDEVLPELHRLSGELNAGFAELAEIRRKAGAKPGEPLLGISLADQADASASVGDGERTVASIPDSDLVERAVRSAGYDRRRAPRWVHVRDAFALGSTYSMQLCRRFGFDPDEQCGEEEAPDGD